MSDTKPLGVTLKAPESSRYAADNPWFVFEGEPRVIGQNIIETLGLTNVSPTASLAEIVLTAQVQLTALAHAVRGDQAPAPAAPEPAQQQPAGWGNSAPAAQPAWSQPQQSAPAAPTAPQVRQHPEGKSCACGTTLIFKEITSKKNGNTYQMWTCPLQQRKGDGHDSEFVN